ncbi:hypothetical protein EYR40_003894 [Pleurotus pulmonarius]|nr:hypothetical protein EYR40_003894 [Pleurotus pulmonarius]
MFPPHAMRFLILAFLLFAGLVSAQDSPSPSPSPTSASPTATGPSPSLSLSLTTSTATVITTTRSAGQNVPITSMSATVLNVTYTITPTATSSAAAETSPTPEPIVLDTRVDPAFGVLGAILIITGLPSAFWGHKNRWTSFFLIGFYTLSLTCFVLILKFGILPAVNPPSKSLRGYFVLACSVAGIAGGGVAIFFWKASKYFIGAWGGFAFALWIQCFHNGGVIGQIGFRWIMYIGCGVVGFILCTIPKIHYHILLVSTAFVGSSAFILGVDCYTTAGLKEFYIWNLGFGSLFTKFTTNGIPFPVTQTMQIELGLIGARKLEEIAEEERKRDEEQQVEGTDRFKDLMTEREQWEREHPPLPKHFRNESGFSSTPLMKDQETPGTPGSGDHRASSFTLTDSRPRAHSGVSEFFAATPDEEARRYRSQSPGALPALDLGFTIQEDVPSNFIADTDGRTKSPALELKTTAQELEELKKKQALLAEIHELRRSIDVLKSDTPVPSSSSTSRHPSLLSRRQSLDATTLLPGPSRLRPPRETDPRGRVHSMEISQLTQSSMLGESISRPTSAPLRDNDWDAYLHDRKLVQPPTGVSPPIATRNVGVPASQRLPVPPAVVEALDQRKRRESALGVGASYDPADDTPLARLGPARTNSTGGHLPVSILPPKKHTTEIHAPTPQRPDARRTRTFEELNERHREKLHDLQAPLTQAEKEHAEVEAAKQRWERSKAFERDAVAKRQAEKAAVLEQKRKHSGDELRRPAANTLEARPRHSRSASGDKLAGTGSSAKRTSTMKVEDWQKHQDAEVGEFLIAKMSLKRTYTSPHPLATKAQSPVLRRTNSHHHLASSSYEVPPQQSPRVIKEDPFSLSGFFPSGLAGSEEDRDEWNWLCPESAEPATSPESYSVKADYADLVDHIVALDVSGEEELMTRTIEKEDKLGILSLARVLTGRDEEHQQEEYRMFSPYLDDNDPVDHDALYMNLKWV